MALNFDIDASFDNIMLQTNKGNGENVNARKSYIRKAEDSLGMLSGCNRNFIYIII
jgi:hypothetical protein